LDGIATAADGQAWLIHHNDPEAFNTPGEEPNVRIEELTQDFSKQLITVPGYSIKLMKVGIEMNE
jgi:hypothetical protein